MKTVKNHGHYLHPPFSLTNRKYVHTRCVIGLFRTWTLTKNLIG